MQNYIIKELESELEITRFSYDIDGFHYKLKKSNFLKIKEIIIINPILTNNLIAYHFNQKYKKILELYMNTLQDNDATDNTSDEGLFLVLDEISKLRSILIRKYHLYLKKKTEEQLLKKIKILENEIRSKMIDLRLIKEQELAYTINIEEKSKSR